MNGPLPVVMFQSIHISLSPPPLPPSSLPSSPRLASLPIHSTGTLTAHSATAMSLTSGATMALSAQDGVDMASTAADAAVRAPGGAARLVGGTGGARVEATAGNVTVAAPGGAVVVTARDGVDMACGGRLSVDVGLSRRAVGGRGGAILCGFC